MSEPILTVEQQRIRVLQEELKVITRQALAAVKEVERLTVVLEHMASKVEVGT